MAKFQPSYTHGCEAKPGREKLGEGENCGEEKFIFLIASRLTWCVRDISPRHTPL